MLKLRQQICPPAQYIQSLMSSGQNKYGLQPFSPIYTLSIFLYPALCTNIYTKYSKCLQAITNMSSSPVGTRYCVCRPQQICPPAQYIQGIVSAVHTKYIYWAGGHICCGLQTQDFVLQGWRTYLLWPTNTIPFTYWAGGDICCGLQTQYLVYTSLKDIFVVACRHNTLYIH